MVLPRNVVVQHLLVDLLQLLLHRQVHEDDVHEKHPVLVLFEPFVLIRHCVELVLLEKYSFPRQIRKFSFRKGF